MAAPSWSLVQGSRTHCCSVPAAKLLALRLHFFVQPLIDLLRDLDIQTPIQGLGADGFLQAFGVGAQVSPPARGFAAEIQAHDPLRAANHPDQLPLGLPLPAAHTLTLRDLFLHGVVSLLIS